MTKTKKRYYRRDRSRTPGIRRRSMETIVPVPPSGLPRKLVRRQIYQALAVFTLEMAKGREQAPTALGKDLFEGFIELIFRIAVRDGEVKFPNGWGSLQVSNTKAARTILLCGRPLKLPPTWKTLRYVEGTRSRLLFGRRRGDSTYPAYPALTRLTATALEKAGLRP